MRCRHFPKYTCPHGLYVILAVVVTISFCIKNRSRTKPVAVMLCLFSGTRLLMRQVTCDSVAWLWTSSFHNLRSSPDIKMLSPRRLVLKIKLLLRGHEITTFSRELLSSMWSSYFLTPTPPPHPVFACNIDLKEPTAAVCLSSPYSLTSTDNQ